MSFAITTLRDASAPDPWETLWVRTTAWDVATLFGAALGAWLGARKSPTRALLGGAIGAGLPLMAGRVYLMTAARPVATDPITILTQRSPLPPNAADLPRSPSEMLKLLTAR